ncbi:MAG: tRNA preQ1(34) S-adenosylmethionine ribosyltransferase-isomerase QueA [Anaerolineales bacterium]|nr:tRNA preQ1(34) S-adenosylmethionine ribosyltransferase-isomerase QueA [Anaerolineales bacterium]MCB8950909.1 tRNA preQ1(34) S-adenosylmethionine ribosyltransferase-isomerase QueA [Ardenticatenales bacterium]
MRTEDFAYELPASRIAQTPLTQRDASRLLVLDRRSGAVTHRAFTDLLDLLQPGDILVANNSRVMPARLHGRKTSGGRVELLLLEQTAPHTWKVLAGGKKLHPGVQIRLLDAQERETDLMATITATLDGPQREVTFNGPINDRLDLLGHTPLPPYIHQQIADAERYQTIYARPPGSAAAPTAGLHFTPDLLLALREKGVLFETVTLHVGLDTFKPVEVDQVMAHTIHSEWVRLTPEAARRINEAKLAGGRVVAVGTTSVRVLETAAWRSAGVFTSLQHVSRQPPPNACPWKPVAATEGHTDLFIYPGYYFRVVDALITNFHLPQSTLMMLVSAFAGIDHIRAAYQSALALDYRFLSFGDAMFIA